MTGKFQLRNSVKVKRWAEQMKAQQKKKLGRAIEQAAREIVERTQSGKTIEGGAMKQYHPDYRDWKMGIKSKGSNRWSSFMKKVGGRSKLPKAGRSGEVNLTLSGRMLTNIRVQVFERGNSIIGRIFFPSQEAANKAAWNQPKRPFFGLSRKQREDIINKLK